MSEMNLLIVVPARAGSKGVPGKNLKLLAGKPLVSHVLEKLLEVKSDPVLSGDFDIKLIISTDSEEVSSIARDIGIEVPFIRPAELSGDHVSLIPVSQHAMQFYDQCGWQPDYIMSVQPTCPLISVDSIRSAVSKLREGKVDSVVSVARINRFHPFRSYRLENDRVLPLTPYTSEKYLQKQDRPDAFGFTGAFYLRHRRLLEKWNEKDFCLGENVCGELIPDHQAIDIDSLVEFYLCETILTKSSEFESQE